VRRVSLLALLAGAALVATAVILITREGSDRPRSETVLGRGADRVWLFRPDGKTKDVVVFVHGLGGPVEDTPRNHRPWIDHLVERGSAVVYPRYEVGASPAPMKHIVAGVRKALAKLDTEAPVGVIGYSRGGRLALEYAAASARNGLPEPRAVMSVFPSALAVDEYVALTPLDPSTRVLILVGDHDGIGRQGALELLHRLRSAGFPAAHVDAEIVHSTRIFKADHLSALRVSAPARAAFWTPADRLVESAVRRID
jgi:pimeloyl-ACP methyl ester carboxylesterase